MTEAAKARFPRSSKTSPFRMRERKAGSRGVACLLEEVAEAGLPKCELQSKNPRADSVTNSKVSATSSASVLSDMMHCSEEMAVSKKTRVFLSFSV